MPVELEQVATDASRGVRAAELVAAYDANERDLFGFVLAVTRDAVTAEDLVQEAFLRLVREAHAGRYPDNPRSWLYRVAVNLARTRARRRVVADRWRHLFVSRDVARSPEEEFVGRERSDTLQRALAQLSTDGRIAFLLASDGHSGEEVAALIGRSEGATRTLLWRARRDLRRHLEREGEG
jgi:RNA polymerase sigma-70 factor (ECF subfamily)